MAGLWRGTGVALAHGWRGPAIGFLVLGGHLITHARQE